MKVYYVWYEDEDDLLGNEEMVHLAVPLGQQLFTRDPDMMELVDRWAHIHKDRLEDLAIVKLRILYFIYKAICDIQQDNCPVKLPTKKWLVLDITDDGNYHWNVSTQAPGGDY